MPGAPAYDWVVFDADGTLFDFERAQRGALEAAFAEAGGALTDDLEHRYRRISRRLWSELEAGRLSSRRLRVQRFEELFAESGLDLDPEPFSASYLRHLACRPDLLPGAEPLVDRLAGEVGLLLATNGLADVQRPRFEASPLKETFAAMVVSEEIGVAKPQAGFFDHAFGVMGDPPRERVLMVGDSLSADIAGAHRYGVDSVWFNPAGRERGSGMEVGAAREVDGEGVEPTWEVAELAKVAEVVGLE